MAEIALHIMELLENCVQAEASLVDVTVTCEGEYLSVTVTDDGCGMDEELLRRVESPFTTTRTTRKVGLGIPRFKQLSEMCQGTFSISSEVGKGTTISGTFRRSHIDLPPMGSLADTVRAFLTVCPEKPDVNLLYTIDGRRFVFDTREIRMRLGGVPFDMPNVQKWISEYLTEGLYDVTAPHTKE